MRGVEHANVNITRALGTSGKPSHPIPPPTSPAHTKLNWKIIIAIFHVGWSGWLVDYIHKGGPCVPGTNVVDKFLTYQMPSRTSDGTERDGTGLDRTELSWLSGSVWPRPGLIWLGLVWYASFRFSKGFPQESEARQ